MIGHGVLISVLKVLELDLDSGNFALIVVMGLAMDDVNQFITPLMTNLLLL